MQPFDLTKYLSERKEWVETALEQHFPPSSRLEKRVVEAARYSLFAGGKRLRPILCLAAAEAVSGSRRCPTPAELLDGAFQAVMPVACALEMIHTYSLIHDDLPAMDNDDFRRGRPTNHKVFGEAMAILAGDALLTEAFVVMAGLRKKGLFPSDKILEVMGIIAEAAGAGGMIGGQTIDLESESREVDIETVEYMHRCKTGALITASLEAGAVLMGGAEESVAALTRYGHHLGLAFQITDDLLDVEGEARLMGKTPGSDVTKNKKTYPALMGVKASHESAKRHVAEALESLSCFDGSAEPLRAIAKHLLVRKT